VTSSCIDEYKIQVTFILFEVLGNILF